MIYGRSLLTTLLMIFPLIVLSHVETPTLVAKRKELLTRAYVQVPTAPLANLPAILPLKEKITCDFVFEVYEGGYSPKMQPLGRKIFMIEMVTKPSG